MPFVPVIGKSIKKQLEEREEKILSPFAALNKNSSGRHAEEEEEDGKEGGEGGREEGRKKGR